MPRIAPSQHKAALRLSLHPPKERCREQPEVEVHEEPVESAQHLAGRNVVTDRKASQQRSQLHHGGRGERTVPSDVAENQCGGSVGEHESIEPIAARAAGVASALVSPRKHQIFDAG